MQEKGCFALGKVASGNYATRRTIAEKGGVDTTLRNGRRIDDHTGREAVMPKWKTTIEYELPYYTNVVTICYCTNSQAAHSTK